MQLVSAHHSSKTVDYLLGYLLWHPLFQLHREALGTDILENGFPFLPDAGARFHPELQSLNNSDSSLFYVGKPGDEESIGRITSMMRIPRGQILGPVIAINHHLCTPLTG